MLFTRKVLGTTSRVRVQRRHVLHSPSFARGLLSCFLSYQRPPFSKVQELTGKGRVHITETSIVLLVLQPSTPLVPGAQRLVGHTAYMSSHKFNRIYVPLPV